MKQESSVMMRTALLVLETSPASERMPQPSSCPAEIKTTQFAPAALAFSRSSEAGQLSSRGRRGSLPALQIKANQLAPAALACSHSSEAGQLSSRGRRGSLPTLQIKANQLAVAALAFSHSSEAGQLSSRGRRASLPTLHKRRLACESLGSIESFLASRVSIPRSRDNRSAPLLSCRSFRLFELPPYPDRRTLELILLSCRMAQSGSQSPKIPS
jgi:hypothetical protein